MSLTILTASRAWTALGWTMLHFVWVGAIFGLVAVFARRLLRAASPESRYGFALASLFALAASPIVIFNGVFEQPSPAGILAPASVETGKPASDVAISSRVSLDQTRRESRGLIDARPVSTSSRWKLDYVVPYLPTFWLAGSLSTLFMLTTGLIGVARLRRSSRNIQTSEIVGRLRALAGSLGIARRIGIGICDRLAVPVLIGIVRPLILLPPAALCGWSVEQLEMVLLHELAHLRRWDNLVNLIQRIIESLLFFHPVVWWLSGWVRLERELCCDRLVVGRLGQPSVYAEMLVALAGSSHQGRRAVVAMADRQVLTRIRRLFNLEDRSMELTMPEGIGLVGALIIGASLAFGLQAAQPKAADESEESVRNTLKRAVQAVLAVPQKELRHDFKPDALANIAQAQIKLGDRTGALATLQSAYESIGHFDAKKKNDMGDIELLGSLTQVAKHQSEAGDQAAARKTLDRVVKLVDSLESHPIVEELVQITGTKEPKRKKHEMNAFVRCELLLMVAEEQVALGDRNLAVATCRRALAVAEPQNGILKPMVLTAVATSLHKAGDLAEARKVITLSRRLATELPDQEEREGALGYVTQAMAETGDFDGALQLTKSLKEYGAESAIRKIVDSFTEYVPGEGWFSTGGIKLTIGAESLKLKDSNASRIALPKLVQFAREIGNSLFQARTLSMLAHLQAKAGDYAGAIQTAESIPNIKRKDFPGPSDGYYDALKPCTLAIIAPLQFENGDKAGAGERLHQAIMLTGAIEAADQKIVSQIVIVRKQIECNDLNAAKSLLRESIPLAQRQSEPLRSRGLAMLSLNQIKAGDATGARETIRSIRDYPGLEKVHALNGLADLYAKKGDQAFAQSAYREALGCIQSPKPSNALAQMGKTKKSPAAIAAQTFIDFEYELEPGMIDHQRQMVLMFLHANLDDIQQAVKVGSAMAPQTRDVAFSNLAGNLARKGKATEAMKLAETLETAEQRLMAYDLVAIAIRDARTTQ